MTEQPNTQNPEALDENLEDVEGHRNRADRKRPDFSTGAERKRPDLLEDEDVEGHRFRGSNVQPPRDSDLGGTEH